LEVENLEVNIFEVNILEVGIATLNICTYQYGDGLHIEQKKSFSSAIPLHGPIFDFFFKQLTGPASLTTGCE
jgi:hypothetical protein